jgi:hypothetical protein
VTGQVTASIGETRTERDYACFLEALLATGRPTTQWRVIADDLNAHISESVVRLVARLSNVDDDLGEKRESGVLAVTHSREGFLGDPSHRICFLFTPKHAPWLN